MGCHNNRDANNNGLYETTPIHSGTFMHPLYNLNPRHLSREIPLLSKMPYQVGGLTILSGIVLISLPVVRPVASKIGDDGKGVQERVRWNYELLHLFSRMK